MPYVPSHFRQLSRPPRTRSLTEHHVLSHKRHRHGAGYVRDLAERAPAQADTGRELADDAESDAIFEADAAGAVVAQEAADSSLIQCAPF